MMVMESPWKTNLPFIVKFSIPTIFPKDSGEVSQMASHVPSSLSSSLHENNKSIINDKGIIFFISDSFATFKDIKNGLDERNLRLFNSSSNCLVLLIPKLRLKSKIGRD